MPAFYLRIILILKDLQNPSVQDEREAFSIMYQSINSVLALEYPLKDEFFRID